MSDPTALIELTQALIRCPSVTPQDAGCLQLIADQLTPHQFEAKLYPFEEVSNLWLRHGSGDPVFCFSGHVDVVPPGDLTQWQFDPFSAQIEEDKIFGRGACDMKGNLAAFVRAARDFVIQHPDHPGTLALLITSDEEGDSINGTKRVLEQLQQEGQRIDYCLVGESTCTQQVGDTIKIGRRGSLTAKLKIQGKQGHIAYPQLAKNPIHLLAPFLTELVQTEWDQGNADFDPTSCQVTQINAGVGATNVIPPDCELLFNFRYCPEQTLETLKTRTEQLLQRLNLPYRIDWIEGARPYYTGANSFIEQITEAVSQVCGIQPQLTTTGGTSDGRFFAPYRIAVAEFGGVLHTAHQVNELIRIEELISLEKVYGRILEKILLQ